MTTNEYLEFILTEKTSSSYNGIDEFAANEVAQLISGSFIYLLYETLWINFFDMEVVTKHLEDMYDSKNYFGLIYFIFILTKAVDFILPQQFVEMSAQDIFVPFLSAAIIEDWIQYNSDHEITEIND